MRFRPILPCLLLSVLPGLPAAAQLTSGVSGPGVDAGTREAGYRAAYDPDTHGLAQRIHYDHALSGSLQVRGVLHVRKTEASRTEFDYVQAELRWQLTPDSARWQQGVRADLRLRDGGRPGQVAAHWLHQVALSPGITTRFAVIASAETGDNAARGVLFQTRGDIAWKLGEGVSLGGELYNDWGRTGTGSGGPESHLAGPFVSVPLTEGLTLRTSALAGLTGASPDATFRVFLTQAF